MLYYTTYSIWYPDIVNLLFIVVSKYIRAIHSQT